MEKEKVWVNSEMPKPLAVRADKAAQNLGVSRSAIVRWALIDYLPKIENGTIGIKAGVSNALQRN